MKTLLTRQKLAGFCEYLGDYNSIVIIPVRTTLLLLLCCCVKKYQVLEQYRYSHTW